MCKKVFTGQTNKHIKECFVKNISYIKKINNVHKHFYFIYTCEYAKQKYKMYRKYSGLFMNKLQKMNNVYNLCISFLTCVTKINYRN